MCTECGLLTSGPLISFPSNWQKGFGELGRQIRWHCVVWDAYCYTNELHLQNGKGNFSLELWVLSKYYCRIITLNGRNGDERNSVFSHLMGTTEPQFLSHLYRISHAMAMRMRTSQLTYDFLKLERMVDCNDKFHSRHSYLVMKAG